MSLPGRSARWPARRRGSTAGRAAPTRWALSTGVRRSSSPSSRRTGTSGSGPGPKSGASGAFGQRSQRLSVSLARAVARSNGSNASPGIAAARSAACRWRSAGSGGVLRSQGSGDSSQVVAAYSVVLNGRGWWRLAIDRQRAPAKAQERRGVTMESRAHRSREGRSEHRVEVAGEEDREQVHTGQTPRPRPPLRSITRPRMGPRPTDPPDPRGRRPRRGPRATSAAAERAQHTRHGLERLQVERTGAIRLGDRVEHEAVHPPGVTQRVAKRDLRSVGRSVQSHLFDSELLAQRVDVVGRVAARVEGPAWPEPPGAGGGRVSGAQEVRALERPAAKHPGAPAAALVVDDQVAVAVRPGQRTPLAVIPNANEADCPGPPASATTGGRVGPPRRRARHLQHEQRDAAGHGPGAVERDAEAPTLENRRAPAALEVELRLGDGRASQGEARGQKQRGNTAASH